MSPVGLKAVGPEAPAGSGGTCRGAAGSPTVPGPRTGTLWGRLLCTAGSGVGIDDVNYDEGLKQRAAVRLSGPFMA